MKHVSTAGLDPAQRRIVIAVAVAAVALVTVSASFNYILTAMLTDLDATDSQSDMARQVSSIGALLVIFVAGALGERLGARRVLLFCTALYGVGSLIVAVAPVMAVASLGLLLAYVGKSAAMVVALAYMSARISDADGRAAAFATFSAVMPIAYLIMPVLAGVMVGSVGWRWVAVVWAFAGLCATVAVARLLPHEPPAGSTGELVTPTLAGIVLAVLVQLITVLPETGLTVRSMVTIVIGVAAAVGLVIGLRRFAQPSLSLAPLRHGGLVLLLIVLLLTLFANLWFYTTMALQYIFGLTALAAAIAMLPAQVTSIVGAAGSGKLVQRKGITFAGTALLVVVALMLIASALIGLDTPVWVIIAIVSVYSAAAVGAGVALTNAIMNQAAPGEEGSASAFRGAATNLGSAIGVVAMSAVVFAAASTSLTDQSTAAGLDPTTSQQVAAAMKDGATSEDVSSLYAVPVEEVDTISALERGAYLRGYQAHGLIGGAVTLGAAALFFVVRRRQEASSRQEQSALGAG